MPMMWRRYRSAASLKMNQNTHSIVVGDMVDFHAGRTVFESTPHAMIIVQYIDGLYDKSMGLVPW